MDLQKTFLDLGIALTLGLLVGLQRERSDAALAGIRTFALITVFGALAALLAEHTGGWILAAGVLAVSAATIIGNVTAVKAGEARAGITTEIAALLMFGVGALVVIGPREVAVVLGGAAAVLLQAKTTLHRLVARLGDKDLHAIMQFVLISLVILPVVPDRTFGPYGVLNPRDIWLMVVLVVGMSLGGYIAYKFTGRAVGSALAGLLGGLISSTAATVSAARGAAAAPGSAGAAAAVIMIASTVVFGRVLVEIGVVAPNLVNDAGLPILTVTGVAAAMALIAWSAARRERESLPEPENPTQLRSALIFASIYAAVIFAVAAARDHFGSAGVFTVAVISGLTDMDAITLSTARLAQEGRLEHGAAWRSILLGALSNIVFKGILAGTLGGPALLRRIAPLFAAVVAAAAATILFWPA